MDIADIAGSPDHDRAISSGIASSAERYGAISGDIRFALATGISGDRVARASVAAVLAGGAGSRMGRPKAVVPLGGVPLITYVLDSVSSAKLEPVVVAKPGSELPEAAVAVLREPAEPRHPLVGLIAALRDAEQAIVAVGCDTPFLPPGLLAHLATTDAEALAVEAGGRIHPLIACYSPAVLPAFEDSLAAEHSLTAAVEALGPATLGEKEIREFGDPELITFNVNRPEDLARAEEIRRGLSP